MADVRQRVPEGRYGRAGRPVEGRAEREARTDRRLKITGGVLGVAMVGLIVWIGGSYLAGEDVSGELIKFKVVSDEATEAHLEVRKDAGTEGVCTVRVRSEDGAEVGRKDVPVDAGPSRVDTVATVRTAARATSAELVGCSVR